MSLAVVSTLWMDIYSRKESLNTLLAHLGISAQPFIHSAKQALPSIAVMSVWQGCRISDDHFRVDSRTLTRRFMKQLEMDHASAWQKFKDITLPELKHFVCLYLSRLQSVRSVCWLQPMVMTGGDRITQHTRLHMIFMKPVQWNWEMGLASTMAIVFTIFVVHTDNYTECTDQRKGGRKNMLTKSKKQLTGYWQLFCWYFPYSSCFR